MHGGQQGGAGALEPFCGVQGQQLAVGAPDDVRRHAHHLRARPGQEGGVVRGDEDLAASRDARGVPPAEEVLQRRSVLALCGHDVHVAQPGTSGLGVPTAALG